MSAEIIRHGKDDFSVWVTDDLENIHSGWEDIYKELVDIVEQNFNKLEEQSGLYMPLSFQ